jgi:adenylate kinase family enzyme
VKVKASPMSPRRIMIFGRPGSGKSTFATRLAQALDLPLYHVDKYFFCENWEKRPHEDFLADMERLVAQEAWIIDGNAIASLPIRLERADMAICFVLPLPICLWRIVKRFFLKNPYDDRAKGCKEKIRWPLITYTVGYRRRIMKLLQELQPQYPNLSFRWCFTDKSVAQVEAALKRK